MCVDLFGRERSHVGVRALEFVCASMCARWFVRVRARVCAFLRVWTNVSVCVCAACMLVIEGGPPSVCAFAKAAERVYVYISINECI